MNKIYIGIDPDVTLNGVAYYVPETNYLSLHNLNFWNLIKYIQDYQDSEFEFAVIIEGGWLNSKSNWHGGNKLASSRIAKNVGSNHQVGKLLVEYCGIYGISHEVVKPRNLIKGKKIDAKTFKAITKYEGRTNQETRDAAMLVFGRK